MEKEVMNILNASIGLLHLGKENLDKGKSQLEKMYQDLVTKGAADNSEATIKIRESVDKVLLDIKEFSSVAGKNYEDTRAKILTNYNKIAEEIKTKVPSEQLESVKAKITEVAESFKKTATTKA